MNIQSIFQSIQPYRVVRDLGLTIEDAKGQSYITHPTIPGERIWLINDEFVSLCDSCNFVAGGVFDFLAFFLGDYEKAVKYMFDKYETMLDTNHNLQLNVSHTIHVSQLTLQRAHFLGLINLRNNLHDEGRQYAEAANWMSGRKIDTKHGSRLIYAAKGLELTNLLSIVSDVPKFQPCDIYVVLPYFSNYHTFSRLIIKSMKHDEPNTVILNKARHSFFGLHTVHPEFDDVRITNNPEQAAFNYSIGRNSGNFGFGVVHPYFDTSVRNSPLQLRTGTFITNKDFDLALMAKNRSGFLEYNVATDQNSLQSVYEPPKRSWMSFAVSTFRDACMEDGDITPRIGYMLDDLRFDPEVGRYIMNWMQDIHRHDLLKKIQRHVVTNKRYYLGEAELEETPAGYVYKKPGSTHSLHGSNFTLRLTSSTWFSDNGDLFHYGWVLADGVEYPFCISRDAAENPKKLLAALQTAIITHTKGAVNFRPTIYDANARRYIMMSVNEQMNTYSSNTGLRNLGWNTKRTMFNAPSWQVSLAGLEEILKVPHPFCNLLSDYYMFSKFTLTDATDKVTPQIKSFLALQASMVARLFLKRNFPIISVLNNVTGLKLLCAMFLPFGQVRPIELNTNRRREVSIVSSEVENYPIFGNCQEPDKIAGMTGYIFALSRAGTPFTGDIDKELFYQIFTMAYHINTQITLRLLRDGVGASSHIDDKPITMLDHVLEGRRLIETMTQYKQFNVLDDDLPNFRGVLSEIALEDINRYFKLDIASSTIRMNFTHIKTYRRQDVHKELLTKHPSATMYNKVYIVMNADAMTDLLGKFYGTPVTVFADSDPRDTVELGQMDQPEALGDSGSSVMS